MFVRMGVSFELDPLKNGLSMVKQIRTKIVYLYRDASNYKYWGEFHLSGSLELADVRPLLFQDEYFLPEKIGVQRLTPACMNSDDHDLHEFVSAERVAEAPCPTDAPANEFINRLRKASSGGWFV